jgi:hypothetical protein
MILKSFTVTAASIMTVSAASGQTASVCARHDNGAALDFWLGEWDVSSQDGETPYGHNRIEKTLDGCAVFEHWAGAGGGEGKSLFFFNARTGQWEQIWVTTDSSRPGGLKHKKLIETYEDGGVRFQGEYPDDEGGVIYDRTTLTPLPDGEVRQHIEISQDEGATWRTTFDAVYRPTEREG